MDLLLPVGSIVSINKKIDKFMIIGYYGTNQKEQIKEYIACNYPRGMCTKKRFYFNGEDIDVLYYVGGQNIESVNYRIILKNEMTQVLSGEKNTLQAFVEAREKYLNEDTKELRKLIIEAKREGEKARDGDNSITRDGAEILDESNIFIQPIPMPKGDNNE